VLSSTGEAASPVARSFSSAAIEQRNGRPYTPARSATADLVTARDGERRARSGSIQAKRARSRSLHTPPATLSRHLSRTESPSLPGIVAQNTSSASEDGPPRPASPFLTHGASYRRRSLLPHDTTLTPRAHHESTLTPKARPLSQLVLPTAGTSISLADIAASLPDPHHRYRQRASSRPSSPAPSPSAATEAVTLEQVSELLRSVDLSQARATVLGANRERALTLDAATLARGAPIVSPPLSNGHDSLESGASSKRHLLGKGSHHESPHKDRRISLSLGFAKGKKAKDVLGTLSLPSTPEKASRAYHASLTPDERRYEGASR
jgi:hypothetical protein